MANAMKLKTTMKLLIMKTIMKSITKISVSVKLMAMMNFKVIMTTL